MWVSLKKNKKNKRKNKKEADGDRRGCVRKKGERLLLLFFYFLSLLSSIYRNRTVEIRRGKKKSALLDEGYAWEPKTRDFTEFLIKNYENPIFWFFLDIRLSDGQNW